MRYTGPDRLEGAEKGPGRKTRTENRRQRWKEAGREAHNTAGESDTDSGGEEGKQTEGEKESKGEQQTKGKREDGNRPAKGARERWRGGERERERERVRGPQEWRQGEGRGGRRRASLSDAPQGHQSPRPAPRLHIWPRGTGSAHTSTPSTHGHPGHPGAHVPPPLPESPLGGVLSACLS